MVSLAVANGIPIFLLMLNKRQKIKGAAFRLRIFGWFVNGVSVIWIVLSIFILCVPPVIKNLTWRKMNYASVVLVLFLGFATLGYVTWGSSSFTGPEIETDYFELNNLEAHGRKNLENFVVGDEDEEEASGEEEVSNIEGDFLKDFESNYTPPPAVHRKKTYHLLEGSSKNTSSRLGSKNLPKFITSNNSNEEESNEISTESDNEVLFEARDESREQVAKRA